jgi:small subunit ribosomal protein S13
MATLIAGVVMKPEAHVRIAVQSIYGIGQYRSLEICKKANIDPSSRFKLLSDEQIKKLQQRVLEYSVEGDLRREVAMNIKHLREINCYRGNRHKRGLPVRGQRTRTNARTRKGPLSKTAVKKKKEG